MPAVMTNQPSEWPASPVRSWFRFGLRSLLLVMTVIAALLAFYFSRAKRAERAANELQSAGADVLYDYQRVHKEPASGFHYSYQAEEPGPAALRKTLGDGFFQNADWIKLDNKSLTSSDLRPLQQLTTLRHVSLVNCRISDEHMKHLGALHLLESVDLKGNDITDKGLSQLGELAHLKMLSLSGNNLTGSGFEHFSSPNVRQLFLYENPVSDTGLASIGKLSSLQMLGLARSEITDEGLAHLKGLDELTYISLNGTAVTDAGLEHLRHLRKLSEVELFGTRVTPEGVHRLQSALPDCKVIH